MDEALIELFGEEVQAAKKSAKLSDREQEELTQALSALLRSEEGMIFIWWLLNQTHVFQSSYTGNSATYFLEGERNVGLKLYNQLLAASPRAIQALIDYRRARQE